MVCFVSFVVINKHWEKIHHEVHEEHEGSFHGVFFTLRVLRFVVNIKHGKRIHREVHEEIDTDKPSSC